jgi:hypothetical protein
MRRRLAALALAAASIGCTKIVNTDDLDPLASAEGFCYAFGTEYTRLFGDCLGFHPASTPLLFAYQTAGLLGPTGNCTAVVSSTDAGRQVYDRNSAEACLAEVRALTCQSGSLESCQHVLRGAVGPGGACRQESDCDEVSTRGCDFGAGTCPGTCRAPAPLGSECGWGCADGLACEGGFCVAAPGENEPCIGGTCGEGLVCAPGNLCAKPGRTGAPCGSTGQCDEDFFCDEYRTPKSCQPFPEDPSSGLGERCGDPWSCEAGLWCDYGPVPPACKAKLASGVACNFPEQCAEGLTCRVEDGGSVSRCLAPQKLGTSCKTGDYSCQPLLSCDGVASGDPGKCVAPARLGEYCGAARYEFRECMEGWCDGAVCKPFLALGAACTDDDECSLGGSTAVCNADGKCEAACY